MTLGRPTDEYRDNTTVPSILIRGASPNDPDETHSEAPSTLTSPKSHRTSRLQVPQTSRRKRTATEAGFHPPEAKPTENMSPRSSKTDSESTSKKHSSSTSSKSKSKSPKTDDWTEVSEPEERRRIQNRIAQRKFREKTRENKEKAEREARNQKHAASCYQVPSPSDVAAEDEVSGLPWGSFSMRHVVSRGHEAESRRSSGRGEYIREDARYQPAQYGDGVAYPPVSPFQQHQGSLGGSSGGEEGYYDGDPRLLYGSSGHFVVDQFNAAGWPDSPGFGPGFSMAPGTSSDSDGVYYLD